MFYYVQSENYMSSCMYYRFSSLAFSSKSPGTDSPFQGVNYAEENEEVVPLLRPELERK